MLIVASLSAYGSIPDAYRTCLIDKCHCWGFTTVKCVDIVSACMWLCLLDAGYCCTRRDIADEYDYDIDDKTWLCSC